MQGLPAAYSAEKAAREQGLSPNNSHTQLAVYSSLSSDRSSINSAAAGMHLRSPCDAAGWIRAGQNAEQAAAGSELDAQDAAYAFEQLKGIKQMPNKSECQGWQANQHGSKGYTPTGGYGPKAGYGQLQDQHYHTQTDSFEEHEADRSSGMKNQDPVSVLPSHLYSTDDENSTQHLISGSNSAQTQPNTSMHTSAQAASLHLPSISDIYAVIGENQKAAFTAQEQRSTAAVGNGGGSIHYHEYEPSNLAAAAAAASPYEGYHDAMVTSASKPPTRTSPNGGQMFGQVGAFGPQDAYIADAGFMQQINDGLTYAHTGKARPVALHCYRHWKLSRGCQVIQLPNIRV